MNFMSRFGFAIAFVLATGYISGFRQYQNDDSVNSSGKEFILTLPGEISLAMVRVDPGTFTMGKDDGENESDEKERSVTLTNAFWIGKTEVTQTQWKAVMGNNPSQFKGDNLPVENVSWDDCKSFCAKLNKMYAENLPEGYCFDLPTEAQWEYAARGGNKSKGYKYSGSDDKNKVAWYGGSRGDETHPVGEKVPNELGLYDMSGNVYEWCRDWYGKRYADDFEFLNGNEGFYRVIRSGGWDSGAKCCRLSNRSYIGPMFRGNYLGLRIVIVRVQKESELQQKVAKKVESEKTPKHEVSESSSGKNYTFILPGNIQFEIVYVEPGTFTMGIRDSESFSWEKEHSVTLKNSFWIGKTKITQTQ